MLRSLTFIAVSFPFAVVGSTDVGGRVFVFDGSAWAAADVSLLRCTSSAVTRLF